MKKPKPILCSACGLPFVDHAGIEGTCHALQKLKAEVERAELAEGMFAEMQKFESVRNGDILTAADKLRHELKLTRYAMIEGGEEEKYCTTLERINSVLTKTLWIDHEMPIKKGEPTAASSSPETGEGEVPNAAPADHATTPPGNTAGRGAVAAQVNHLINLEAAYKAVCEKREKIPFKWGSQPNRDALQERANNLSGEIMRTERRIIEGLKAFAGSRASNLARAVLEAPFPSGAPTPALKGCAEMRRREAEKSAP